MAEAAVSSTAARQEYPGVALGQICQAILTGLLTGPQADIWYPVGVLGSIFTGQFYSENTPLGILAWRSQVVSSSPGQRPRLVGNIGDRFALGGYVRNNAWNEYLIMARGGTFIHIMNGQLMVVYVDDDPTSSNNQSGFIGIELEQVPSKVSVRDIWIKKLPVAASTAAAAPAVYDSIAGSWKLNPRLDGIEMADPEMCTFVEVQPPFMRPVQVWRKSWVLTINSPLLSGDL